MVLGLTGALPRSHVLWDGFTAGRRLVQVLRTVRQADVPLAPGQQIEPRFMHECP